MNYFITQTINGLSLGSIYALIALGYTMVYGIVQLINFAHGDIIMVGAYVSFFTIPTLQSMGLPLWLCIIPALIICTLLGVVIERLAYRPLRESPRIANLITAIGVSLLLQNLAMKFIGTESKQIGVIFSKQETAIGISPNTIIIIVTTIILTLLLQAFMKRTRTGKSLVAVSEDYVASKLCGINVDHAISITFAIGSALAAVAALFYISTYQQINPTMGSLPGIKAFIAAVLGGIGSIPGAVIGGLILGICEIFTRAYISSQLADAVVFGILIIVLIFKPAGLFGKNVKEKV
ncbi:MAG: branched-chain amino acid ABC transporter permease [Eubacteriales bacterium]|nr:branched-chain amino acid ABC transporter permease [Eubacteriales bacterium]